MQLGSSKILGGIKYIYLIAFFALLSGIFYPVITKSPPDSVIIGVLILFVGLAGGVAIYKGGTSDKHQKAYLVIGFVILSLASFLVLNATGRL